MQLSTIGYLFFLLVYPEYISYDMASGMNNISSELRRSELTDRELGTAAYGKFC